MKSRLVQTNLHYLRFQSNSSEKLRAPGTYIYLHHCFMVTFHVIPRAEYAGARAGNANAHAPILFEDSPLYDHLRRGAPYNHYPSAR